MTIEGLARERRMRSPALRCDCGGPLTVCDTYTKTTKMMFRKRRCTKCGRIYESTEIVRPFEEPEVGDD